MENLEKANQELFDTCQQLIDIVQGLLKSHHDLDAYELFRWKCIANQTLKDLQQKQAKP